MSHVKSGDNDTLNTSLRSSCDRCRAQKLRCVPSSDISAPCQRCLRGKEPKFCTFSRRLQTGKPPGSGKRSDPRQDPRRENRLSAKSLPGMNTFTLSNSTLPEPSSVKESCPATTPTNENPQSVDSEACLASLWSEEFNTFIDPALQPHINTFSHVHEPSSHMEESDIFESKETMGMPGDPSFQSDLTEFLHVQQMLASPPYTSSLQSGLELEANVIMDMGSLEEETPGLLVDLSSLLGKLSHYERELAKLAGSTLDNYPIGDALYFSQRFQSLINHGRTHTFDHISDIDMPTRLLSLSCYILLKRIYLAIFKYLYTHLSQIPTGFSTWGLGLSSYSMENKMDAYRGLRLGQLQAISVGWEPAMRIRKAMAMLLDSLGNTEKALGLPATGRNAWLTEVSQENTDTTPATENILLFEEGGVLAPVLNGRLQKKLREHERNLRAKVEDVNSLLDGLLASSR